ncbi:hypothetical protein GCM10023212_33910 [Luteolibacter yonseiensis]
MAGEPHKWRAGFDPLRVVIRRREKIEESTEFVWRTPRGVNALPPFMQGSRVNPAERKPAVDIAENDGKFFGMLRDVP